jgi:PEGA domain
MGVYLCRLVIGVVVAVAAPTFLFPRIGHTQSGPGALAPASTGSRDTARKLVKEGIAAQDAKDYGRAVALYLKAFSLDPHPLLLFNVAQAYRLAGCPQRAVSFYERYLTLEPKGTQAAAAQAALAEIKRAGKPDEAGCAKALAAEDLAGSSAASAARPMGRLRLHSTPEGAVVMLDGVKIGVTPIDHELAAGTHSIVLIDKGMLVGERNVEIDAGNTVELILPVEYPREDGRHRPSTGPSRILPISCWVGGGLMLAGSGVAFYLGQKGGPDHRTDPYIYRGATPTGFALAGAGAVAVGVGVWLWVRGSKAPESAPAAAVSFGGGYFGWQGRF